MYSESNRSFLFHLIEILIIMHHIAYPEVEGQKEHRRRQLLKKGEKKEIQCAMINNKNERNTIRK